MVMRVFKGKNYKFVPKTMSDRGLNIPSGSTVKCLGPKPSGHWATRGNMTYVEYKGNAFPVFKSSLVKV